MGRHCYFNIEEDCRICRIVPRGSVHVRITLIYLKALLDNSYSH